MTAEQREQIVSKDYLTIADLMELLGMSYSRASEQMRAIKNKSDRLKISGKCHIQDYLDFFNLDSSRYGAKRNDL